MITERSVINALILGGSLILAPFIISSALTVNYLPALITGTFLIFLAAFAILKEKLSICPLLGIGFAGALNFLPIPLTASTFACVVLVVYYVTGYIIIRQKKMRVGNTRFLWPIVILTAIILYHNHSLNVGLMGGDTEGAKPAILIFITVFAYFCGLNLTPPSVNFLSKVPFYYVLLAVVSAIPFLITTFYPALAPYLYAATSSVNIDAYLDANSTAGDTREGIGRLAVFSGVGGTLQIYLAARYPIGTWLVPERWWVAGVSLLCMATVIASGYRSDLVAYAVGIMIATWCHYSWRSFFLPFGVVVAGLLLVAVSSNGLVHMPLNKLPLIAQRSLSFLPGDWDEEAIKSAESSNDFRKDIQDVYIKEYMSKSPFLGNGFSINTKDFNYLSAELARRGGGPDNEYLLAVTFIEGKLFHTGWISVYDCVGIIGTIAFVILAFNELAILAHFIFGAKADHRSPLYPLYVWLMINILGMMISYFTVFGDFQDTFKNLCVYAIVLSQLMGIESTREVPIAIAEFTPEFSRLSGANYGYQSRP